MDRRRRPDACRRFEGGSYREGRNWCPCSEKGSEGKRERLVLVRRVVLEDS